MTGSAEGFVLREIRYGDTGSIVKIYTRDKGLRSFFIKGARPSASARPSKKRQAKAGLFPFLEVEFTYVERRESQTLYTLRQFRPSGRAQTLYGDVSKVCMLTFLSELLGKCLAEGQADEALYDFIGYFLSRLDAAGRACGHYHVWFLFALSRYLGCYPQVEAVSAVSAEALDFDVQEGRFSRVPGGAGGTDGAVALYKLLIEPEQAETALQAMRHAERQSLLQLLIRYYTVQFSLPELKSYAVLREVFQV